MKKLILFAAIILCQVSIIAQVIETKTADTLKTPTVVPVILNGEAQKIPAFENPDMWIKQHLLVETEFDTDGDGKKGRMHVDVTRHQINSRSRRYINYNTNCRRSRSYQVTGLRYT